VAARTNRIVEGLRNLDAGGLAQPSLLPGWSRLTIACHLRYGAVALQRMTSDTQHGRPTAYYPEGRQQQRQSTLVPRDGESSSDVVESLATSSRILHDRWASIEGSEWEVMVTEPGDNPDLGPLPLDRLALMRLTEVEVHGDDLGLGLGDWSETFVEAALPFRLDRLNTRRTNHRAFDDRLEGSWLVVADHGPAYLVTVDGADVRSEPADPNASASALIRGSRRDILALLLGRPTTGPLTMAGDLTFAASFQRAFPGP